jgi:hypothetical protein
MSTEAPAHRPPPGAMLLIPLVVALVLTLFAWPNARLEPRDLPIGIAGPPAATRAIEQGLAANEGAFEVHRYGSGPAARAAIEDREVYGAFVFGPTGLRVLTASAASPAVAQRLAQAASESGAAAEAESVRVQDVVPAPPEAQALPSSVLPLLIAGIITGVLGVRIASGALPRVGLLVAGSVLAGLTAALTVQSWLDVVDGDWLVNAGVLALTVLAIASFTAGLTALLGVPGVIVAALTLVLIGNPFSAVGSAPELLPEAAGTIGQLMPPGAGGNLLRSTGFFDGADAGGHVAVLVVWALAGIAALLASGARGRRPSAAPARALS